MKRRDFLLSTAGLAFTPIPLFGQEEASLPAQTKEIVFADFENGTYGDWTLEGSCWTPEPYSDRLFPGKITGFHGKHFLCTFHPARGTNATGKATSKEFTLERP